MDDQTQATPNGHCYSDSSGYYISVSLPQGQYRKGMRVSLTPNDGCGSTVLAQVIEACTTSDPIHAFRSDQVVLKVESGAIEVGRAYDIKLCNVGGF